METMLYFSYGSNMSTPRLRNRVPSARPVAVARLDRHRLMFHKKSVDGSAKCDAEPTNDVNDVVFGVDFEIATSEKPALDRCEGLNIGYEAKTVSVMAAGGEAMKAFSYCATHIDTELKPYPWYKEHVVRGAREHGLPEEYIHAIAAMETISDPDQARHDRELSIYR
jgi:gamma-glutamylcyclotransferase